MPAFKVSRAGLARPLHSNSLLAQSENLPAIDLKSIAKHDDLAWLATVLRTLKPESLKQVRVSRGVYDPYLRTLISFLLDI